MSHLHRSHGHAAHFGDRSHSSAPRDDHNPVDHQLFVIWEAARRHQQKFIDYLANKFIIKNIFEVEWSPELITSNFLRFYAKDVVGRTSKPNQVGSGPFLAIVVRDENPRFLHRIPVSGGYRIVNANVFDAKRLLRAWAGGGNRIHSTGDPTEFARDLTLLFGPDYRHRFQIDEDNAWDGVIGTHREDLIGARGWRDFDELFRALESWCEYVVYTNFGNREIFSGLPAGGDVDILCTDAKELAACANAHNLSYKPHRSLYGVLVSGAEEKLDIRSISDNYICADWHRDLLNNRISFECLYVPHPRDHFFLLLYRSSLLKSSFPKKYIRPLGEMAREFGVEAIQNNFDEEFESRYNWFRSRYILSFVLSQFLIGQGYKFTFPADLSVKLRISVISRLDKRVQPSISWFLLTRPFKKLVQKCESYLRKRRMGRGASKQGREESPPRAGSEGRFEEKQVSIEGRISPGRGVATHHLLGASSLFREILEKPAVPGTLNLLLPGPLELAADRTVLSVDGSHFFWQASLDGRACLAYRWRACPLHVVEVVSDRHIRAEDGLGDGDAVRLEVDAGAIAPLSLPRRLAWSLLWRYRERLFYTSNRYVKFTKRFFVLRRMSCQKRGKG